MGDFVRGLMLGDGGLQSKIGRRKQDSPGRSGPQESNRIQSRFHRGREAAVRRDGLRPLSWGRGRWQGSAGQGHQYEPPRLEKARIARAFLRWRTFLFDFEG